MVYNSFDENGIEKAYQKSYQKTFVVEFDGYDELGFAKNINVREEKLVRKLDVVMMLKNNVMRKL